MSEHVKWQEITPTFYGNGWIYTIFKTAPNLNQSTSSHPISLWSILILSFYLPDISQVASNFQIFVPYFYVLFL